MASLISLSIIIIAISAYFVFDNALIGPAFMVLGLISLLFLKFFRIALESVYPDVMFGFIDNAFLVFAAVLGGVFGAIVGGAAGNTITDGIGGLFEGHLAERQRRLKKGGVRNSLSTSLGKMAGCLFGAGVALILVWTIEFLG